MACILVVEDSPTQAQQLRLILESEGYEVEVAPDGASALGLLLAARFDLVLSDVVMPGLSGYELVRAIKGNPTIKHVPVILLTTLNGPMDIIHGLECGADNFITKPYEPDYLLARTRGILASKDLRGERKIKVGVELALMGREITITSEKEQILDLLVSTFEELLRAQQREHERKLAAESLERSQQFLQSALDALAAQVAILDEAGMVIAVNAAWRRNAFCGLGAACGPGANYLALCEEAGALAADARAVAAGIRAVMARQRDTFYQEYACHGPGQTRRFVVRVTRFEGAGPVRVVVAHEDVTEKKNLEAQFLRIQRMESLGRLAGGIAQELNNVLTPILMGVELLRRRGPDPEAEAVLADLESSAARGMAVVKQVLLFARGGEGPRTPLSVQRVIEEFEKMLRRTLPAGIGLHTDVAPDLHDISGDATQLYQVLMNLCLNARDAMPHGGRLTVTAANTLLSGDHARRKLDPQPGPYVLLTVADTGNGIPAALLDKVFDPFFTTKEQGKGTGLGLSTVLGIVKDHGGFVDVSSQVGHGTRFSVYLPAVAAAPAGPAHEEEAGPGPGGGELILVVDDEAAIRAVAKGVLEASGYRVLTAENGVAAAALYGRHRDEIRVVLTDMIMPEMDGAATIRALRELDPDLPIIAMTGLGLNGPDAATALAGVQTLLLKPYTAGTMLTAVREVLAARA
jgi:signal transduction histidine kinase/ActR/RegA family two-component response regulator